MPLANIGEGCKEGTKWLFPFWKQHGSQRRLQGLTNNTAKDGCITDRAAAKDGCMIN